jgi:hypothetical protein
MAATPASHVAALRRLFASLEPDKHAQCETLWSRFGTDVWTIMRESFPGVRWRLGAYCFRWFLVGLGAIHTILSAIQKAT